MNPILPRFHAPDADSLFQFSAQQGQADHDAHSFSARRGASRPTGPAYHRGLVLFSYNRPPGGAFSKNMARRALPPGSACQKTCVEKSWGGGARGGGSPPRVGSNALNTLHGKAFSKNFSAVQRRESIGILAGCRKSLWTFRQPAPGGHSLRAVCPQICRS